MMRVLLKDVCIIIQARLGSARLPFKTLLPLDNSLSVLQFTIKRLHLINYFLKTDFKIAVAVPNNDYKIFKQHLKENKNIYIIPGSEKNLASRLLKAMNVMQVDYCFRVTADSPYLVKDVFEFLLTKKNKLLHFGGISLYNQKKIPHGTVVSLLSKHYLKTISESNCSYAKEHLVVAKKINLTKYIFHPKIPKILEGPNFRFSCDTSEDYRFLLENHLDINIIDAVTTFSHFSKRVIYDQYSE